MSSSLVLYSKASRAKRNAANLASLALEAESVEERYGAIVHEERPTSKEIDTFLNEMWDREQAKRRKVQEWGVIVSFLYGHSA